jgi:hypothetical protein
MGAYLSEQVLHGLFEHLLLDLNLTPKGIMLLHILFFDI